MALLRHVSSLHSHASCVCGPVPSQIRGAALRNEESAEQKFHIWARKYPGQEPGFCLGEVWGGGAPDRKTLGEIKVLGRCASTTSQSGFEWRCKVQVLVKHLFGSAIKKHLFGSAKKYRPTE